MCILYHICDGDCSMALLLVSDWLRRKRYRKKINKRPFICVEYYKTIGQQTSR